MSTAVTCVGLLGLLIFGLGVLVSVTRGSTKTISGFKPDPTDRLYKAVRAHGNATEYAPMLAILMLVLGGRQPGVWLGWTMVVATACRYLHAAGMLMSRSLDESQPLRLVGALGTFVTGVILAVATLLG